MELSALSVTWDPMLPSAFRASLASAVMCFLVSDRKNEIVDTTDPKFMSLLCVFCVAVEEI